MGRHDPRRADRTSARAFEHDSNGTERTDTTQSRAQRSKGRAQTSETERAFRAHAKSKRTPMPRRQRRCCCFDAQQSKGHLQSQWPRVEAANVRSSPLPCPAGQGVVAGRAHSPRPGSFDARAHLEAEECRENDKKRAKHGRGGLCFAPRGRASGRALAPWEKKEDSAAPPPTRARARARAEGSWTLFDLPALFRRST